MADNRTVDELFDDYLVKFQNAFPEEDSSVGSFMYRIAQVIAAIAWGQREKIRFTERQFSPSLMTDENILRYGAERSLSKIADETDSEYRARVLSHIGQRPAGGTKLDHVREAIKVSGVDVASILGPEQGQSPGNVAAVILSGPTTGETDATTAFKLKHTGGGFVTGMVGATVTNTDDDTEAEITAFVSADELTLDTDIFVSGEAYSIASKIPSTNLIDAVNLALQSFKPITEELVVLGATVFSTEDIIMAVTGNSADISAIEADIAAYVNGLTMGEVLYRSQLEAIAINNGATAVNVTAPAADVSPTTITIILLGTVTVT